MKAWLNLRHGVPERHRAFLRGLERCGYSVVDALTTRPGHRDILVTWNRIGDGQTAAAAFESRGLPVIVAENASWGNEFAGWGWYTLGLGRHNTAGAFPEGGPERWDSLGVRLPAFRTSGETVILAQRGIGTPPTRSPTGWEHGALARYGGRVRSHPGLRDAVPLERDLADAGRVVTWGSGAAIKALLMGVPVVSEMPGWIGEQDNTDAGRLAMFRRLAWAQWTLDEIASGEPFARLLA